jgi:hypothetical protein
MAGTVAVEGGSKVEFRPRKAWKPTEGFSGYGFTAA